MTKTAPVNDRTTTKDLRRTWRVMLAVLLPVGPLGVLGTRALMPYWTSDDTAAMVDGIAAHSQRAEAMVWAFGLTFPALILGTLVLGYLARWGAPRLATWGAMLTFVGFVMAGALGSTDLLVHVMATDGYDNAETADIADLMMGHALSGVGTGVFIIGHILGLVLLGIALVKASVVPIWAGIAMAASQPIHLISAVIVPSRLLDVTLGWGLTLVAYLMVSRSLLKMSDEEFAPR